MYFPLDCMGGKIVSRGEIHRYRRNNVLEMAFTGIVVASCQHFPNKLSILCLYHESIQSLFTLMCRPGEIVSNVPLLQANKIHC